MEQIEEKNNAPLKDSEISRLIEVSKEVGYKKQNEIPTRNLIDFKPRSIMEIAFKENDNKNSKDESPKEVQSVNKNSQENETRLDDNSIDEDQREIGSDNLDAKKERPLTSENSSPNLLEKTSEDQESLADKTSEDQESLADKTSENQESLGEGSEPNLEEEIIPTSEASSEKTVDNEIKNNPDPINLAKEEGIEIGKKMTLSEAEKTFGETTNTLKTIIENLKSKDAVDKSELMKSILTVVTKIASERAGEVIDDHPDSFKEKITSFIDDIDRSSKKIILNLNPHDAKLIGDSILDHFSADDLQIKENSDLFRGDSILQLGSIEIGDIISERITLDAREDTEVTNVNQDNKNNAEVNGKKIKSSEKDE